MELRGCSVNGQGSASYAEADLSFLPHRGLAGLVSQTQSLAPGPLYSTPLQDPRGNTRRIEEQHKELGLKNLNPRIGFVLQDAASKPFILLNKPETLVLI